jgi:hypothetical protein
MNSTACGSSLCSSCCTAGCLTVWIEGVPGGFFVPRASITDRLSACVGHAMARGSVRVYACL